MNCSALTNLDFATFDTSEVKIFNSTFNGCSNLINLVTNSFKTDAVPSVLYVFRMW